MFAVFGWQWRSTSVQGRQNRKRTKDGISIFNAGAFASYCTASHEGAIRPTHRLASVFCLDVASPPPPHNQRESGRGSIPSQCIAGNIGKYSWECERQTWASCLCLLTLTTDTKEASPFLPSPLVLSWEHHFQLLQILLFTHPNLIWHRAPLPFTGKALGGCKPVWLRRDLTALSGEGKELQFPTFTACLPTETVLQRALEIIWVGLVSEEIKRPQNLPSDWKNDFQIVKWSGLLASCTECAWQSFHLAGQ